MNNTIYNNPAISITETNIPPLKKTHPVFNSLVLRVLISVLFTWKTCFSDDPEITSMISEGGIAPYLFIFFIAYLILVSIAESVGLLFFSAIRRLVRIGRREN